jgi:integration host factor subunit alpha
MVKKDTLAQEMCDRMGYPKTRAVEIIDSMIEIMKSTLESGEDVLISGFGKFYLRDKRTRRGRNPATGDEMMLPARRLVMFRASRTLRDAMNGE